MLNPEQFGDVSKIREGLRSPYLIIENALVPEVAEQLYNDLLHCQQWEFQDHDTDLSEREHSRQSAHNPDYTYSRGKITLGTDPAPASLNNIFNYLRAPEQLAYFSEACGRSCDDFQLSATLFSEGNHIAEHNDYYIKQMEDGSTVSRALTFNYYLTKHWQPEWGGRFIWKAPYAELVPRFNTLVLFPVGPASTHFVEAVKKEAEKPRLALTGWYLSVRNRKELP